MAAISNEEAAHGPMLSLTEAAALLRCHHNTIRAWVRQGKLEAVPMGAEQVPLFRKRDVEALKKPLEQAGVIIREDKHAFPVVGIGASAGGLDAVSRTLAHLPTDLGLAYVVVQHLETEREAVLADLLRKKTAMPVFVIENGMQVGHDRVYVAPSAMHVAVINGTFTLRAPQDTSRPIDAFFTALANEYQNNAIGVVLSGTGTDGTDGLRAITAEEGLTLAQDASALEQGMPRNAQEAEVVDLVVKPEDIGKELTALVKELYAGGQARIPSKHENELRRILQYLHAQRGIDFTQYKEATIHRRIIRRMVLSKCRKLSDYSALLHGLPSEVDTLCNDMLINVTSFFRDPLFYKALDQVVFPALLKDRATNDPLRIWISACAGGEEVVSVAITLLEHIGDRALTVPVQIFATDLNERTIEKARLGIYKKNALQTIPPEQVKKYFQHVDGHFQVIKAIRDMCVFAKHDLLKDPPFSRVDLISCQNMLIYLENHAQERVVKSFHYALKPTGFLALGKSESATVAGEIFDQPDRTFKVYTKKYNAGERLNLDVRYKPTVLQHSAADHGPLPPPRLNAMADLDRDTERVLLNRFVPASVLINKGLEIIRFRGTMTPYLAPTTGKASLHLLKMVRDDLAFELRGLLQRVKKEKGAVRKGGIPLRVDNVVKHIAVEVVPMGDMREPHYLVLFTDELREALVEPPDGRKWKNLRDERERRIIQLEQDLAEAREQMRLAAEEAETGQQELQSANEEVVSSNEELQSINEELETSKEELQSINEEFATINEELQARNEALLDSEERYRKLIDLMPVAVYTCDATGHIRLFNEAAVRLWGRAPVVGETLWCGSASMRTIDGTDLPLDQCPMALAIKEERAMADVEAVVVRPDGTQRAVLANPTPLYDNQGKITGAINVLVDISERVEKQRIVDLATKVGNLGIWDWDIVGDKIVWTDAVYSIHGVEKGSFTPTMSGYHQLIHPDDRERVGLAIRATMEQNVPYVIEFRTLNAHGEVNWVYTNAVVIRDGGRPVRMMGGTMNITDRKQAESALRESEERFKAIYEHASFGIVLTDGQGRMVDVNPAYSAMLGRTREELIGKTSVELAIVQDPQARHRTMEGLLHTGRIRDVEMPLFKSDGSTVLVRSNADVVMMGEDRYIISIIEDITERKRDQLRMQDLSARLSLALDSADLGTWNIDGKVEHMEVDERFMNIFGWKADTISVAQAFSVLHPDDREPTRKAIEGATRPVNTLPYEVEYRVVHPDGSIHWIFAKGRSTFTEGPDGRELLSFNGTVLDITDRKGAEEAQRHLAAIVESSDDAILSRDLNGTITSWNKGAEHIFGYSADEIIGRSNHALYPPDKKDEEELLLEKVRNGERVDHYETQRLHKDGTLVDVALTLSPLRNEHGQLIGASKVIRDITEEKRAREVIRLSEERFHLLADNVAQLIWMAEADGSTMWFNKRWQEFTGMSGEELRLNAKDLHHPDHYERATVSLKAQAAKGEPWEDQFPLKSKHGKYHWFLATAVPVRDAQGTVVRWFGTCTDITTEREAQERIRESEARFRLLADNIGQLAWIAEPDGEIHWYNKRWFDYSGTTLEEMRGWGWQKIHHPDHVDRVTEKFKAHIDGEKDWEDTFPIRGADGEYRWFLSRAFPVRDENGRVLRWFGTNTDVTEERRAREEALRSEDRFRMLADNMSQMAYVADGQGIITWVNRRWIDYTGMDVAEMNNGGWGKVIDPAHFEGMVNSYAKAQEKSETWEHIFRVRSTTGEYRWFLSRSVPIKDAKGNVERWFGTNTDITDQKLAEVALEESATHKDHFLATLAHELRNPLAPLKNGLQLMELAPDDPKILETTRAMMVRQLDHMVRLVDDLMDLSRISRGKINLVKADVQLSEVIGTAMEATKPLIERNEHRLHVDVGAEGLVVHGDRDRLTQVVSNLLNNAAKYTPRGGRIDLIVEREKDQAVIRVKDNGIGIDPEAIARVFDMFAQVEATGPNVATDGLGIGLNVVQRLVRMHHGEVEAHSEGLDKGSEFVVRLPLLVTVEQPSPTATNGSTSQSATGRKVLVVDDNEDIALSLSMLLKKRGHTVHVAHDGEQALEAARTFLPDLVLMDIGMPRMNGYEACARLRETPWGKGMYIIAVSGWGQDEDRKKSQNAGFDGHVVKPIERATLERLVTEARPYEAP